MKKLLLIIAAAVLTGTVALAQRLPEQLTKKDAKAEVYANIDRFDEDIANGVALSALLARHRPDAAHLISWRERDGCGCR